MANHEPDPGVKTFRTLMAALTATPAAVGVALGFVLAPFEENIAPSPVAAVFILTGLIAHFACLRIASDMLPVDADPAESVSSRAFHVLARNLSQRLLAIETLTVLPALVLAMVVAIKDPSSAFLIYLVSATVGTVLMMIHVYPRAAVVRAAIRRLEANGARTGLAEAFALDDQSPGFTG